MVELTDVSGFTDINLGGVGSVIMNILVYVIVTVVVIGIAFIAYLFIRWFMRYRQYTCIIWRKDVFGNTIEVNDGAGIFVKDKKKLLWLKSNKVGLNPDKIPYVQKGKKRIIYLVQNSLKSFSFVKLNVSNPNVNTHFGEEDLNWGIAEFDAQKKIFVQNWLMQYMPLIMIVVVSFAIIIIFFFFFKNLDKLQGFGQAMATAANALKDANAQTVVMPGS